MHRLKFRSEPRPKFSFVIPIYDREKELHEALLSCLNQDFEDFEIIAVLDGSPDATVEVVRSIKDERLRIFRFPQPSGTACRPRNKGILEARGDFIVFLDSDDLSSPCRLSKTNEIIVNHENVDVIYGAVKFLTESSRIPGIKFGQTGVPNLRGFSLEDLISANQVYITTVAVRKQTLLERGGFRLNLSYREDYELWLRLKYHHCEFRCTDEVLSYYRIHENNNELNFKAADDLYYRQALELYAKPFTTWC